MTINQKEWINEGLDRAKQAVAMGRADLLLLTLQALTARLEGRTDDYMTIGQKFADLFGLDFEAEVRKAGGKVPGKGK